MHRPIATAFFASLFAAVAMSSQEPAGKYPLMEGIAQKVIQKYQSSSCEQLLAEKQQPPNPKQAQMKDKAFEQLHKDPEMRKAFIDKVAAPIVNKMFECGMNSLTCSIGFKQYSAQKENDMGQRHLTIDFPIKGPANAKALTEELPALMPDFAKTQDQLGTVHFSRFMVKGDEKLLFLSDIDGEVDQHIGRLVERGGPVFDAIFKHVDDPPATPVASDPQRVIRWLKSHIREPLDTYFVYEDASVQDIKEAARAAGVKGNTSQSTLLTYMEFKSRVQGFVLKLVGPALLKEKATKASDAIGTLHVSHFVPFENNHVAFFTVYDGNFEKYIQDFADKTSFTFDALFPNIVGGAPTPVAKNVHAFMEWASENNYPPIGFYSAYPGLSVQDIKALLADRKSHAATTR